MLHRMRSVYRLKPNERLVAPSRQRRELCFIMAGINDIYADAPVDTIFRKYTQLIDTLREHKIVPIIQSTLHVNPKWKRTEEKNPDVTRLNALLREYARSNSIEFIDLNTRLSTNAVLRDEYTTDGVPAHRSVSAHRCAEGSFGERHQTGGTFAGGRRKEVEASC